MSTQTLPALVPRAKAFPADVNSREELDAFVSTQKLPIGTIDQIPDQWKRTLDKHGVVTSDPELGCLMLTQNGVSAPVNFDRGPLLRGQMVFLYGEEQS